MSIGCHKLLTHYVSQDKSLRCTHRVRINPDGKYLHSLPPGWVRRIIDPISCANRTESGKYLGLDLGGTNFRVLLITLEKGRMVDEVISYYTVAEHLRLGPGENLFRFLAECILDFLNVQKLPSSQKFNLGFTFSFPMTQQGLDVGLLVK